MKIFLRNGKIGKKSFESKGNNLLIFLAMVKHTTNMLSSFIRDDTKSLSQESDGSLHLWDFSVGVRCSALAF
jgi:hypothetical protein